MKLGLSLLVFFATLPSAMAQTMDHPRAEFYVVAAPIGQAPWGSRTTYVAGGGQAFLYRGLSLGAEVGPIITNGYVYGLGSANLAYHALRQSDGWIEPFVTGGYSVTFRAGLQSGSNVGAGANICLKKKVVLRFEYREYLGRLRVGYVGPRFGVTFR
jgi:hypothetical protein